MSVSGTTNEVRYTGDGVTVAFTITFPFQEVTHIRLFIDGALTTSGFTITGGSPTGTITFDSAPADGSDIFMRRVVPLLQGKSYPTNDTFPSASHEAALDSLTYITQQLSRDISFSLSFPEALDITAGVLPTPEDDKILAWDGTDGTIKNGPTTAAFTTATDTAVAAAATATTQAGISTTQAGISTASALLAQSWAIDDIGDNPEGSAKYWSEQAEAFASGVNLPALGTAYQILQVNAGGTALAYADSEDVLANAAADVSVNSQKIIDVADPTNAQDASTKEYVDSEVVTLNSAISAVDDKASITIGTKQATTSGTSKDFNSLPTGIKRIAIGFETVSTNGTDRYIVQLGDSGGLETSGYQGCTQTDTITGSVWSSGIVAIQVPAASGSYSGVVIMHLIDASTNTWAVSVNVSQTNGEVAYYGGGTKSLSAVLDRIRITTEGGTNTFDLGNVNITYEIG
jgi:hypothetical protein